MQEKICRKIVFFYLFRTSSRKFWTIRQKYSQDCQNYIQIVQRSNFRTFLSNEETLLKFFGRWAKLLDFWLEFFVKFLKTAAYGCSGTFWCFLERKVTVWSFLVSEWKKPSFGKKFMAFGRVAKSAFHVSSAKLWEKMTKLIYTIIIFFGTFSEIFYDFEKK